MSARWFRTCSARLPVRSSCSRNCPPTFLPFCSASPGRSPWWAEWEAATTVAVGSRGSVGGVAVAAGPAGCGYLGPAAFRCLGHAGDWRGDRGCNARCDCAGSSVSGVRDGAGNARCRVSDRCGVVFPCFRRTPATGFTVGAGRWRFAGRRRAGDPFLDRGAPRIPPGQSRFRSTHSGHSVLPPFGAVPLGVVRSGALVVIRPRALRVVREPRRDPNRRDSSRTRVVDPR